MNPSVAFDPPAEARCSPMELMGPFNHSPQVLTEVPVQCEGGTSFPTGTFSAVWALPRSEGRNPVDCVSRGVANGTGNGLATARPCCPPSLGATLAKGEPSIKPTVGRDWD